MKAKNKQGKMSLYCIITIYQLLMVIVHRLHYHNGEKSILLLPTFFRDYDIDFSLLRQDFFDEVYWIDYSKWGMSTSFIKKNGMKLYRESVPYALKEFEEIVVAVDQFPFSVFLVLNQIDFSYLEESSGVFLNMEKFIQGVKRVERHFAEIGLLYGTINAKSKYVRKIYANVPRKYQGDYRVKRFCVMEDISSFSRNELLSLANVFRLNYQDLPKCSDATILLTEHFANLGLVTLKKQIEIYEILVDYFATDKKLIVKPHPSDGINYKRVFSDAMILPRTFPVELIGEMINKRGWRVLTLQSSSLNNLSVSGTLFPDDFIFRYKIIHEAFVIAKLHLYLISMFDILLYVDEKMKGLIECIETKTLARENCHLKKLSSLVAYRFENGNSPKIESFLSGMNSKVIVVLPNIINNKDVIIKRMRIYTERGCEEKLIYLLAKEEVLLKKIADFHTEYELSYSKVVIKVEKLTREDIEKLVLEAKLEMLQREIEEARKENEELKFLIDAQKYN